MKSTYDGLTGLLWRDDCQVCWEQPQKIIAAGDEQPHVWIRIGMLYDYTSPLVLRDEIGERVSRAE